MLPEKNTPVRINYLQSYDFKFNTFREIRCDKCILFQRPHLNAFSFENGEIRSHTAIKSYGTIS